MKRTYEDHLKDQQQTSSSSTNSSHQTDEPPIGTVNNTSNNTINSTSTQILTQQHAFHQPSHQATVNSNPMMIPINNNNNTNSTIPSNSHHNRIQSNAGITSSLINNQAQPSQSINNSSIRLQQQNFEQALKKPKINPQQQQQSTSQIPNHINANGTTTSNIPINTINPTIPNLLHMTNPITSTSIIPNNNSTQLPTTSQPTLNPQPNLNHPNLPLIPTINGIPNISNLPPLSMNNFLFTTPPFLQAAAAAQRNRSNSNTSNSGNIPYPNPTITPNLFIPTPSNLIPNQRLRSNSSSNNLPIPPIPITNPNLQNTLQNRLRSNSSSNLPPFFLQQPPTNLGNQSINSNPSTPQKKPPIQPNSSTPNSHLHHTPTNSHQINHNSNNNSNNNNNTITATSSSSGGTSSTTPSTINNGNNTNNTTTNNTNDQTRSQKLRETWYEIYKSLKKLETFVNGKRESQNLNELKPWENDEHVLLFTTIYNLCILPDSVYYEEQLYNLYSIYIKKYLQTTILPKLKDKYGEDLLNEIVFIWINFRDIFVKFCSYIFKYLDQFYVASNTKRTLKYEAYYLFKTSIFDHCKVQLRQILLDKITQDRKFYNSDNSYYISQRQLLKQTLQLFSEMDDPNITLNTGGLHHANTNTTTTNTNTTQINNIGTSSGGTSSNNDNMIIDSTSNQLSSSSTQQQQQQHSTSEVYVDEFEKYAEKETSEFYHKIANEWIEKYNLTEYLLFAEECIQQEQTRIQAIFPTSFSQNKLMKLCDLELLKNMQKRLLEMSGSGVKILIRDEKFDDLKRLYRLMNRLEGGLDPIADLFKQYLIFVGNELFVKYENASSEMIKSNDNNLNNNNNNGNNNGSTSNTSNNNNTSNNTSNNNIHIISNEVYSKVVRFLIDSYVQDLLELHQKMKNITNGSFSRNVIFHKAMSEGFKQFVNKNITLGQFEIRIVQLFAYYTDDVLRKKSDEKKLDCIVDFIQFFSDRDMFIEEHRKLFAIRLLVTDYQELEERMMISKLKYHYRGVADTYKLEKMLTDKTMANDMKLEFQNYITTNQLQLSYDVNVTVLTMGMWPLKAKEHMLLPKEFLESQHLFKQFYDSRNGKRVLKWVYSKSMAQIHAHYINGNHLFELSTLQASILLLFNDQLQLSVKQIEDLTGLNFDGTINQNNSSNSSSSNNNSTNNGMNQRSSSFGSNTTVDLNNNSDIDLKQSIISLSSTKFPILIFNQKEMTLSLNENFTSRSFKLKIPLPRITQKDTQGTQTSVSTDRVHILDACVVRIMKTRKTMNIQSLFNEVSSQLIPIFTPDVKQIKKRIESLLERDFLKRDEQNNSILHYVA